MTTDLAAPFVAMLPDDDVSDRCRRLVDLVGELHVDPQHEGRVARLTDDPRFDAIHEQLVWFAALAAPRLGIDFTGSNYIYAKLFEYPTGSGGVDWHDDQGVDPLTEAVLVARGDLEQWQTDEMSGRRVNLSMQLTPEDDYDGGDLQCLTDDGTAVATPRTQGAVTAFPSGRLHRVTPIVRGMRLSLVGSVGYSPRGPTREGPP